MKTLNSYLLLFTICAVLFTSMKCEKDKTDPEPQLPAETQTGANTFGCLVDGKVYLPKGKFPYAGLTATIQLDILNISSSRGAEALGFAIGNLTIADEYVINTQTTHAGYSIDDQNYNATDGKVIITKYDKVNNVISGRFNFNAKDSKTGKTVAVTDGRFDVKYTN